MLKQISYFDVWKPFLDRRSFCELVMLSDHKESFGEITDSEFTELKHLAMRNLIRGCEIDDVDNPHLNKLRGDYNE